jgi:hypothetical protein
MCFHGGVTAESERGSWRFEGINREYFYSNLLVVSACAVTGYEACLEV